MANFHSTASRSLILRSMKINQIKIQSNRVSREWNIINDQSRPVWMIVSTAEVFDEIMDLRVGSREIMKIANNRAIVGRVIDSRTSLEKTNFTNRNWWWITLNDSHNELNFLSSLRWSPSRVEIAQRSHNSSDDESLIIVDRAHGTRNDRQDFDDALIGGKSAC